MAIRGMAWIPAARHGAGNRNLPPKPGRSSLPILTESEAGLFFAAPSGLRKQEPGSLFGDRPDSGNAVKIGSGPATVRGAAKAATRVWKPLERSGKVDVAAPSQETCPKVPSRSCRLLILASWNGRMGYSGDIAFRRSKRPVLEQGILTLPDQMDPVVRTAIPRGGCETSP
jgi:hypothetical protein